MGNQYLYGQYNIYIVVMTFTASLFQFCLSFVTRTENEKNSVYLSI